MRHRDRRDRLSAQAFADDIAGLFPEAVRIGVADTGRMAGVKGAYLLLIHLGRPVRFRRAALGQAELSGWLAYAGSARGPGGIGARLARHFRTEKPVRWHVDELANAADQIGALALADACECDLAERLAASGCFVPAMRGFGSSDCQRCEAHLFAPRSGTSEPARPTDPAGR